MTLEEQAERIAALQKEFPGWEVWVSLDGWWHARVKGAIPPQMVHAESVEELAEQIRSRPAASPSLGRDAPPAFSLSPRRRGVTALSSSLQRGTPPRCHQAESREYQ